MPRAVSQGIPPRPGRPALIEVVYRRHGTLPCLAAWDVHHANRFDRVEPKTGIEPFGRLVERVMTSEPYASARTVYQLPRDAPQHARAQPRDLMRGHDHHGRVSLARDFEQRVGDVDLIRHCVRFRVKRESPRQLGPLGGDPRGVLVLQAIDRRDRRRVGRQRAHAERVRGPDGNRAQPRLPDRHQQGWTPANRTEASRTAPRESSEPSYAITTGESRGRWQPRLPPSPSRPRLGATTS